MKMSFLTDRPGKENTIISMTCRAEVVRSAIAEGIILDDDLAMVPETIGVLAQMVGVLRDDLYKHHAAIQKPLQPPLIANCFSYGFAKGAEAAYSWNGSPKGKVDINYLFADAIAGRAGAQVSQQFADLITLGMTDTHNVFVDFQNNVLKNPKFNDGGRLMADVIASGFFWATQVGLDYGMNKLGFP